MGLFGQPSGVYRTNGVVSIRVYGEKKPFIFCFKSLELKKMRHINIFLQHPENPKKVFNVYLLLGLHAYCFYAYVHLVVFLPVVLFAEG